MSRALVVALILLSGCTYNKPVSTSSTNNPTVPVSLLFEHEGCKVYRFEDDGRYRYFADCANQSSVSSEYTVSCGKNCMTTRQDETTTDYSGAH